MEIWKDIVGYEDIYQVSNKGRIKSLPRKVIYSKNKVANRKGRFLIPSINKDGYESVCLQKNRKRKYFLVHRLVAQAFIPNDNFKLQVNHKNGVKNDNDSSNLEWCTGKENMVHAVKNGLHKVLSGENHISATLTNKQVAEIRSKLKQGVSYGVLMKEYGVNKNVIYRINKRITYKEVL